MLFPNKSSFPLFRNTLVLLIALFLIIPSRAQAPNSINYQAVIRNSSGVIMANQSISLRASVLSGSASGTSVYSETHSTTTTSTGQINLKIGEGTVIGSNAFSTIGWGTNTYFLQIEIDPAGGSSYVTLGTTQLVSVPYALYSNQVKGVSLSGQSVAVGLSTGSSDQYWYSNTFIGDRSGNAMNGGYYNTFVGESSGRATTTGTSNSFFGTATGRYNTIGSNNSFFGKGTGNANTIGAGNTFIGTSSGKLNTTANENTFLGYNAGTNNTTGARNTFLGAQAGTTNATGSGSVFIGYKAGFSETASNKFYLANNADSASVLMLGDFSTGNVALKGQLETKSGGIKFPDGTVQTTAATGGGSGSGSQNLSLSGRTLSISNGNSVILPVDSDADTTNELQTLSLVNRTISLSKGNSITLPVDNVNDIDADTTNELQSLSLSGQTLSLSKSNSVNLGSLTGDNLGNHTATTNLSFPVRTGIYSPNGAKIVNGWQGGDGGTWWVIPGATAHRFGVLKYGTTAAPTGGTFNESDMPFVINSEGNVGIGETNAMYPLTINESTNSPEVEVHAVYLTEQGRGAGIYINENYNGAGIFVGEHGAGPGISIQDNDSDNTGNSLYITHAGTEDIIYTNSGAKLTASGTWTNASDSTKKYNIKTLKYGIKTILDLKPVSYNWKNDHTPAIGFIAQEVKLKVPEVVFGKEGDMSMAYDHLVAVLVKAIQEQQQEIELLKQKNNTLQGKVESLNQLEKEVDRIKQKMQLLDKLLNTENSKSLSADLNTTTK